MLCLQERRTKQAVASKPNTDMNDEYTMNDEYNMNVTC
jgi:hypothetical protein